MSVHQSTAANTKMQLTSANPCSNRDVTGYSDGAETKLVTDYSL